MQHHSPLQMQAFASGGNKSLLGKQLIHQASFLIDGLPAGVKVATVTCVSLLFHQFILNEILCLCRTMTVCCQVKFILPLK